MALTAGAASMADRQSQKPLPAAVSGVITDGATNLPIAGASVEISRTDGGRTLIKRVNADSKGRFVLTDVSSAVGYWLTGSATGYVSSDYGWEPGASDAFNNRFTFRLGDGEWRRDIVMRIWRRPSISGRVTDEFGQPVVGVVVRGYSVEFVGGFPRLVATGEIAATDDRGIYRLVNLEPAQYKVGVLSVQSTVPASVPDAPQERAIGAFVFGLRTGDGSNVSAPAVGGTGNHRIAVTNFGVPPAVINGRARAYPAVFYPGVPSLTDAEAITLNWGTDRDGVDIQLRPTAAFTVSGRVEAAPGGPLLLRLMPAGFEQLPVGSEVATTVTEKDGGFTLLNVPAGNYTLIGQDTIFELMRNPASSSSSIVPDPPGFPSTVTGGGGSSPGIHFVQRRGVATSTFVKQALAVRADVSGVIASASPTISVRGRIIHSDGSQPPAPNTRLVVSLESFDGDPIVGNPSGYADPAGAFVIEGVLPGRYRVATGRVISSMTWRGRDIADGGVDVSGAEQIDDIAITVTGTPARIDATVTGLTSDTRAAVIVFPATRDQWKGYGLRPTRIASANTNVEGVVSFPRLPAGDYLAIAVEPGRVNAWVDPAFLAAAAASATRVSVGWGETKAVTLKVELVVVR